MSSKWRFNEKDEASRFEYLLIFSMLWFAAFAVVIVIILLVIWSGV